MHHGDLQEVPRIRNTPEARVREGDIRDCFRICTDCGGKGATRPPVGPKIIQMHKFKKRKPRP
jgi:hypothetical protein